MGRSRKGKPIHGWLILDKPMGLSSGGAVGKVRWLTGAAKVGHCGTLDPLATGVLPLALGEATKTTAYAMDSMKTYRFQVRWGEARSTDDAEGEVIQTSDVRPTESAIQTALDSFTGEIEQTPPQFSAIKVNGKRAYALARANQKVELKPRRVQVNKFTLVGMSDIDHGEFEVVSGKGTYMRSLARDLAVKLGTVGYVSMLRRTQVGPFTEKAAISLDNLEALGHSPDLLDLLLPVETALDDIPALALTEAEAQSLRFGQSVPVLPVANREPLGHIGQGKTACAMTGGKLVAMVEINGGEIRPLRVFNL